MEFSFEKFIKYGLYYSALVPLFDAPNILALYLFIPSIFIFCFLKYKVYYENRYLVILSLFVFWILCSCVTTNYWEPTFVQMKELLGTIMMCYILSSLSISKEKRPFLYTLWIAYYVGMLLYIPQMEGISNFDYTKDRLNDSKLNANTIAYQTFFLTYVLYILGDIANTVSSKLLWKKLFFLTMPLSLGIALITGSRQVLLIQIPLILLLICTRYTGQMKHAKLFIISMIFIAFCSLFVVDKAKDIFANSVLATRYEKKIEDDSRSKLIKDAIQVGCENPILGVGPGNYVKFSYNKHFSHCSYTELFANSGILALLIYIYLLWTFLKRQIMYYVKTKDKIFIVFFIFGVFYTFDNFFYVFYYTLWLFPFFFLVASHSEYHFKEIQMKA